MAYSFPDGLVPGFSVKFGGAGAEREIECGGTLDARDSTTALQSELLKLHEALVNDKVNQVKLDVRSVDYMNSSGIKAFLTWFLKVEGERRHQYKIELTYDSARSWQSVSCAAMGRIAQQALRLQPKEAK